MNIEFDDTPYHDLFVTRLEEIKETKKIFAIQTEEWVQEQQIERNTITPLLSQLIKKTKFNIGDLPKVKPVSVWDKFKRVRWTLKRANGKVYPFMEDVNINDQLREQSYSSFDWLYDIAWNNFLRDDITADQWNAFENLIWNRGVPLILH